MSRAVRIPRSPGGSFATSTSTGSVPSDGSGTTVRNQAGWVRGLRTFLFFVVGMSSLYLVFLLLTIDSPLPGVRTNYLAVLVLTALLAAFVVIVWWETLARVPRSITLSDGMVVVVDRYGRARRFPRDRDTTLTVLHRYPSSAFAREPTELVRLKALAGRSGTFLIAEGIVPRDPLTGALGTGPGLL
jgi:hypothetical protein